MGSTSTLPPELKSTNDPEVLRDALEGVHPEDLAEMIGSLSEEDAVEIMKSLPPDMGSLVMERLSGDRQVTVLESVGPDGAVDLLSGMAPDDRVDVLQRLPGEHSDDLIARLARAEPQVAEEVRELGAWGEDTAGGLMTTAYVALSPETKVWEGIEEVRRVSRERGPETIYYIYVCGYGGKLLGVVSLRDLILADPSQSLADVMKENVVHVSPTDDQEAVAAAIAKYDLSAIPVTDDHGRILGVVTVDDVVDVVIQEATEDAQLMGGVVPLEASYFETGLAEFIWKRATWLVVLFLGQLLTAVVMERNRTTLSLALELVVFLPLIIASGGNAGSQSSSLIIRALAVGEVRPTDWLRVLVREICIGIALGLVLGLIGFARSYFLGEAPNPSPTAFAVGASIVAVVILGTMVGCLMPLIIRRLGLDPAVSSTPFIASVVDVLGLIVYFGLARLVLGLNS